MKTVLIISYYFPPMGMGGVQRIAKFVKFLPEYGWNAKVITVKPVEYYAFDPALLSEIPDDAVVRTQSFDPLRVAAWIKGRNKKPNAPGGKEHKLSHWINRWLAFPDSKRGWIPFAYRKAKNLIEKGNIAAVITTSPPLSAHLAGLRLKRKYNLPWIADFRDYWTAPNIEPYPSWIHSNYHRRFRKKILQTADRITSVSDGIIDQLNEDASLSSDKCAVLTNGFDPTDYPWSGVASENRFQKIHPGASRDVACNDSAPENRFQIVSPGTRRDVACNVSTPEDSSHIIHMGARSSTIVPIVRPEDRFQIVHMGTLNEINDPHPFLQAVELVLKTAPDFAAKAEFHQVGVWFDQMNMLSKCLFEVRNLVFDEGYHTHRESLRKLCDADLPLFVLSDRCPSGWISGRLFEYLPLSQPFLAIAPEGEAAQIINRLKRGIVVSPDNIEGIAEAILHFYLLWLSGSAVKKGLSFTNSMPEELSVYTRKNITAQLAKLLDGLINL